MSTTSGAHGGGMSVESRDGGEELSTPAVKRRCEDEKNSMSLVSGLGPSVHGESVTLSRHLTHQHQHPHPQYQHHSPQHEGQHPHLFNSQLPSYHPLFYPSHPQVWHLPPQHQPPVHSLMCLPPCYPSLQPPPRHPNYPPFRPSPGHPNYHHPEATHLSYYQPSSHIPNPFCVQNAHVPPAETPHHQSNDQTPPQSSHMYQPSYEHLSLPPHHSPLFPPRLGNITYQHPRYHHPSTLQSSQLPSFQLANPSSNQTHFNPFHHKSFQALVQPVHSYEPSSQPTRSVPSHPPPPPLPDSPLGKYAIFLRGYYTQHHAPCNKWPQLHTRKYINLAVINNKYANRKDLVQFRQQTIHGCVDDILEWKAPIRMKAILKPNCVYDTDDELCEKHEHYPVTQLLIEGAPGIGKSTFAWEVCQKWGQQNFFSKYSLVVLLKFRDKRVQEAKSISELFYYPHPKLQSEIVDCIVFSGGHGLLLILEGFDEAPASKRTMDSIFVRLFSGQELPKATVILTTRPSASAELRELCKGNHSRRIEIVGFGKKEIDEYIQCAFSDEQSRSDFKEYLSLYPHIHSMMYVPLNSAIVTHVYESCKSSGAVVPKTMTQLYSSLIRTLLLRYLKDKEEYKDTCINVNSFKYLPQPVYDKFCKICKIAHKGIVSAKTELIFQDLPSDFDPLGLMQSCPELYVDRGASVSYNFLHLTVQEYLAAYHISQQSRDKQIAFMRKQIKGKKLEVVVRFLAGLTELGRDLWDDVRGFAGGTKPRGSSLKEETDFIKLKILHLLFESQRPSAITSVLGSDCVCFSPQRRVQPFDWYVLGYCITNSSCNWRIACMLKDCKLESVELFLRALNSQQGQCQLPSTGKIKEMWLRYEGESNPAAFNLLVENMPQLSVFHNLTHLNLSLCNLTSETCNLLSKCNLQHLEYLDLGYNLHIGRGGAVNLITSLTKFCTIRELDLRTNGIGFEDCKALSQLLASCKCIEQLKIGGNKLSPDSILLIVDGLSHNTSLERLGVHSSNFSSDNVFHLASVLRVNTRLKVLYIDYCNIQSSDSVHLANALEENTTTQIQTLCLDGNPIGSEGAVAFADMLATNKSLVELDMRECSIQGEGAVCLAKALEKNFTVREFNIGDNQFGSEGAVAFADMLATNKNLVELDMRECSIQGEGAVCLAKAMEKNSTVREFNIGDNQFRSEGAVAFASMLKKNQCLKKLDLRDGSVGVEGALELIESLKHITTLEELELSKKCKPPSFFTLDKTLQDRVTFR